MRMVLSCCGGAGKAGENLALCVQFATATLGTPKQKVIVDCDLAGDVDDAYAVAWLLGSPESEVLGLAIDHGNTPGRARVAGRLLHELGLEDKVPLVVGRVLRPELFTTRPAHVRVADKGMTELVEGAAPNCESEL